MSFFWRSPWLIPPSLMQNWSCGAHELMRVCRYILELEGLQDWNALNCKFDVYLKCKKCKARFTDGWKWTCESHAEPLETEACHMKQQADASRLSQKALRTWLATHERRQLVCGLAVARRCETTRHPEQMMDMFFSRWRISGTWHGKIRCQRDHPRVGGSWTIKASCARNPKVQKDSSSCSDWFLWLFGRLKSYSLGPLCVRF